MRVRLKQPRLQQLLAGSKLSQNHWALKLGLSRGHWSDIVNGKHPFPSPRTRLRMLETFGVQLDELFEIESGVAPWADLDFRRAIADRWLIDSELGQGGMGAVYLGRDVRHGRTIAVKVISPEAVSGIGVDQFLREIATVAQLQHPHILPLFDSGESAGHPFYVMPYIRTGSLRARLAEKTRLPIDEAVELATGAAAALDRAHRQRILHCDVKPENILLDERHAYVMDFGIARKLHTEVLPWTLRRELDLSAGTPAYVSPEQASGERELDARSDVYSLACVTYEMLTGHTPFEGTSTESVVSKRFFQAPPPMREFAPEIPSALETAVLAGMALEPAQRPESAALFADMLTRGAAGSSSAAARVSLAITRTLSTLTPRRRAPRIGGMLMEGLWQDLVHAWRGLRRAPGFALVVILTLGMALGANATMFGLADRLLFRAPAGIGHPDQLRRVLVARWIKGLGKPGQSLGYPSFADFRDRTRSFQSVAAFDEVTYSYGSGASARPVNVTLATGQYFPLLEIHPLVGRVYGEPEDVPNNGARVAVLSHTFWRSAFGGDPKVVGRTIDLGKRQFTVIGVAPEGFTGTELSAVDMWIPMSAASSGPFNEEKWLENRGSQWLQTIVRLKPGVADGTAADDATKAYRAGYEASGSTGDFHRKAEASFAGLTGATLVGAEGNTGRVAGWLLAVTVMLLVIACANVANLVLARGLLRRGEIAVRLALGVSRGRLLRQLLTESLLLAGLGFALGLVLVRVSSDLLRNVLLPGYTWEGSALNGRVLAVTIVATLFSAVTASLLPLWRGTRTDVAAQLHGANRSTAAHSKKLRAGLLLLQTGLSTALLIGAGLFLKSLNQVKGLDLGFEPTRTVVVSVDLQAQGARGPEIKAFYRAAWERVRRLPGIQAAGLSIGSPFMGNWAEEVKLPGSDSLIPELAGGGPYYFRGSAGYLEAMGVRLLRGRLFTEADDRAEAAPVVIVSDLMARTLWKGKDALGQCLIRGDTPRCHTVIGVVADLHRQALEERDRPFLLYFTPLGQDVDYGVPQYLFARVNGDPEQWTEPIRKELLAIQPDLPYVRVRGYQNTIDARARSWSLGAAMLTVFGALSLIIAAIGLYGVLSFAVTQRTQELGIRAALGATPGRLMKLILGNGVVTAVVGVVLGTALALMASSRITPLLFRTSARDLAVYGVTGATILVVAVLASWVPGRRATRVEPVRALKAE